MSEEFKFENKVVEVGEKENFDFQGVYMPEEVSLEDLKEKMRRLASKGGREEKTD